MNAKPIRKFCAPKDDVKDLLQTVMNRLGLSARAYDRILKFARTIADLEEVGMSHWPMWQRRCSIGRWIGSCGGRGNASIAGRASTN